jgi:diketogulonate reductase-like aldo/keto reductase
MSGSARRVRLHDGSTVPALGQGTWRMGSRAAWKTERDSLRLGIELGMTLIDTAEMYGDGAAEQLVGEAIAGIRDQVFLVSKVLPGNASRDGVRRSCQASLKRLDTDRIDLYLLHWRGSVSLGETIDGFEALRRDGMIGDWGVSNFDVDDMHCLVGLARPRGCLTNQVLYNLEHRGIEFDLLRYGHDQGVPLMAYSPVGQGGALLGHPVLADIAAKRGATPAQVALAWTLRHPNVISIPKAASAAHVRENAGALSIVLQGDELAALDRAFPPPERKHPLAML